MAWYAALCRPPVGAAPCRTWEPRRGGGGGEAAAAAATHAHSLSHSLQRRLKMYVLGGSNRMQNPQAQQRESKALEKVLNKTIHSGALRALSENAESRRLITSIKTCFHQQKKKEATPACDLRVLRTTASCGERLRRRKPTNWLAGVRMLFRKEKGEKWHLATRTHQPGLHTHTQIHAHTRRQVTPGTRRCHLYCFFMHAGGKQNIKR